LYFSVHVLFKLLNRAFNRMTFWSETQW
jgi:hypothetical protein